jgi:HemY protein
MPGKVAAYRQHKRERDGNKGLREALKALFEGRFGHAEKAALRASELPENAGVAALIGARRAPHAPVTAVTTERNAG